MILLDMAEELFVGATRLACGMSVFYRGAELQHGPARIFFANHGSQLDFLAIWAALPVQIRKVTRPVAARDYWERPGVRGLLSKNIFRAIYVDRQREPTRDPLDEVRAGLREGCSIIIFPEGTRSLDGNVAPFKSGIHRLATEFPHLELVPVYLENLSRILPKGEVLPLPLLSRVIFGDRLHRQEGEEKNEFLARARDSLLALKV